MLPSPKELNYFYEVALTLNFSKAAKLLNTSQPALSMAIKRLENKLNTQLFHRYKDGLLLSQQGKEFLVEVKDLLEKWENVKLNVMSFSKEVKGRITIGCNTVQSSYMAKIISDLLKKHPALELNMKNNLSQQVIQGVLDSTIDVGIVLNPPQHPQLSSHKIRKTDLAFWRSGSENQENQFSSGQATILCDSTVPLIKSLLDRLHLKNIPFGKVSDISNFDVISELAQQGCGIAILPECYVELYGSDKLHRVYELPYLSNELSLIYHKKNGSNNAVQTVVEEMKEYARRSFGLLIT